MDLDRRACDRARRSRDARFDGRFFIGVTTTRVYCRPVCPARAPRDENVVYLPSAAAAEAAGFRPCLRCRPEASPGTPAWNGTSGVVARGLRLIEAGALDEHGVERLAERLGVTSRHLRRLFLERLGATPRAIALTRRVHFAKKLIDETALGFGHVAAAAGFGSQRRFNGQIRRTYSRTPTQLRRLARRAADADPGAYRFRLAFRPPYDWDALLAFLAARATPGVERVEAGVYSRTIALEGGAGTLAVSRGSASSLTLEVRFPDPRALLAIVERVRRMFDLGADPAAIAAQLRTDPRLRAALRRHPGLRVPGAWDGFELAVRAILGQQVSVRGATTLAGRVAERFGSPVAAGTAGLGRLFPTASQLRDAPIEETGVVHARAEAIRGLARRVASGTLRLDGPGSAARTLNGCPGIGPWTAAYVGMRAFGEPDAFPAGDLVLCRRAGASPRELERVSQAWRPWRAYAAMLLWQGAADAGMEERDVRARQARDDRAGVRPPGRVLARERRDARA